MKFEKFVTHRESNIDRSIKNMTTNYNTKTDESTIENVRVCVRFRPMNMREIQRDDGNRPWEWDQTCVRQLGPIIKSERGRSKPEQNNSEADPFVFDRIFDIEETTEMLYCNMVRDLVHSAMEGKHVCAMAYGPTSTGKTFTMQGTGDDPGIIPRTIHDVFSYVKTHSNLEFLLRVSYLEVYNECINDLLDPSKTNLKIYDDKKRGPIIHGLEEKIVISPEQIFGLISSGEAQRHIGSTDFNAQSSRSHTIFRLIIESKSHSAIPGRKSSARVSTLNLVDLAGSEAAHQTEDKGRRNEGAFINKSLLTLTSVIFKLSEENKSATMHIPYRDSKLTRILQNSLQGNSRITIVCTASPWDGARDETLRTLRFARRAKKVKHTVQVNEVVDQGALLLKYKLEIDELRKKLAIAEQLQSPSKPTSSEHQLHLRSQIDETIRNLNRVILNSDITNLQPPPSPATQVNHKLSPAFSGLTLEIPKMPPFRRSLSDTGILNDTMKRLNGEDMENETFFRALTRVDTVVDPETGLASPRGVSPRHRTSSQYNLARFQETIPALSMSFSNSPSPYSTNQVSIANELKSIRDQLSSFLVTPLPSDSLASPQSNHSIVGFHGESSAKTDNDYTKTLEERIEVLEAQVRQHDLERSVIAADRAFLSKLLGEKEQMISEWSQVIDQVEAKQKVLQNDYVMMKQLLMEHNIPIPR